MHNGDASKHVRVLRPLLGTDMYTEMLRCEDQPQQVPACSPDGSMVCVFSSPTASIEVHDTNSGQLKMSQAISMPLHGPDESLGAVEINWSGCGRELLVKAYASNGYSTCLRTIQLVTLYT